VRRESWLAVALFLSGCNLSPEDCDFYRIEAHSVGTLERGGQTTPFDYIERAYAFQHYHFPSMQVFEAARAFLVEGGVATGGSVTWTAGISHGTITILLAGPRQVGDVLEVSTGYFAPGGGLWGPAPNDLSGDAQVGISAADFDARVEAGGSVGGTLTIRGVSPLHLGLDVLGTDDDTGEQIRVQGDMTFQAFGNSIGCD
jgi:hypothetical protein